MCGLTLNGGELEGKFVFESLSLLGINTVVALICVMIFFSSVVKNHGPKQRMLGGLSLLLFSTVINSKTQPFHVLALDRGPMCTFTGPYPLNATTCVADASACLLPNRYCAHNMYECGYTKMQSSGLCVKRFKN